MGSIRRLKAMRAILIKGCAMYAERRKDGVTS
jgi:hypothetical protein